MIARAARTGLACSMTLALVALVAPRARAEDRRSTADVVQDTSYAQFDMGGGFIQPNFSNTTFTTLDTWNGQHTYYHASGSQLGAPNPMGWIINVTAHLNPFSFRGIGLVTTAEFGGITGNTTQATSPFGAIDATNNSYWSVLAGPEAQLRLGSFFARAGVLGGGRYTQIDDYTAFEWRVALRGQFDWVIGDVRRKDTTLTLGLFGGADVVPALGWSGGLSLSIALL